AEQPGADLGDLELGLDRLAHPHQFPLGLEPGDELPETPVRHRAPDSRASREAVSSNHGKHEKTRKASPVRPTVRAFRVFRGSRALRAPWPSRGASLTYAAMTLAKICGLSTPETVAAALAGNAA